MAQTKLQDAAAHMVAQVPHAQALGFRLVSVAEARGSMMVPWREDLVGDPEAQVIAGGVVTALLDHCCGLAAVAALAGDQAMPTGATATLDLRIDYMRPAGPRADVTAEAHCYKLTRNIAFVRAVAFDLDREDPVATAQAAFVLKRVAP